MVRWMEYKGGFAIELRRGREQEIPIELGEDGLTVVFGEWGPGYYKLRRIEFDKAHFRNLGECKEVWTSFDFRLYRYSYRRNRERRLPPVWAWAWVNEQDVLFVCQREGAKEHTVKDYVEGLAPLASWENDGG